jgi:hypothetical protein
MQRHRKISFGRSWSCSLLTGSLLIAGTLAYGQQGALSNFVGSWGSLNPPGPYVIFTSTSFSTVVASLPKLGTAVITTSNGEGGSNYRISGEGFVCYYFILVAPTQKLVWDLKAGDSVCPPNAYYTYFAQLTSSDEVLWRSASRADNLDGYIQYLTTFPSGMHAAEATRREKELREATTYSAKSQSSSPDAVEIPDLKLTERSANKGLVVTSFAVHPTEDNDLNWLKIKIERNLVDYFVERRVPVTHRSSTLKVGALDLQRIEGEIERNPGGDVEIEFRLVDGQHVVVAATSATATWETWRDNYKSISEMMIAELQVIPETLTKASAHFKASSSVTANLLYFEAARLAKMHQLAKVKSLLDQAIAEDPNFALAHWGKAELLRAIDKNSQPNEWDKRAAILDPDHPRLSFLGDVQYPLPSVMRAIQRADWTKIVDHLLYKEVAIPAYRLELKAWAFEGAHFIIETVLGSETGTTVRKLREQSDAILAVNGGFF